VSPLAGSCAEDFRAVRDTFASNFANDDECGAAVAVFVDGEPVVDLWGGYTDEARTIPWGRDTMINVWSSTKTVTALCALVLTDDGDLDVHAPVHRYWPEFSAAGKAEVLVRHLLGHTSGLSGWADRTTLTDLLDWNLCTARLAAQEPWWSPGTASGYHAFTFGFLIGEVVRRVSGVSIGEFLRERIAAPLDVDFHIGLPESEHHRVANVLNCGPPEFDGIDDPDSLPYRTFANPEPSTDFAATTPWRCAEIPAVNGHGNARSLAKLHAALAAGGVLPTARLMSRQGCLRVLCEQSNGIDLALRVPTRFGLGYALSPRDPRMPIGDAGCFWGGWGGSLVAADLSSKMSFAYVMNKMTRGTMGDKRGLSLLRAARVGLDEWRKNSCGPRRKSDIGLR
jgi:CubicO group peptidase (beta-lactamase class C family)